MISSPMAERRQQGAAMVVVFLDAGGTIQSLSPATGQVLGHPASALPGRPFAELLAAEQRPPVREWLHTDQPCHQTEATGRRANNQPYPLAISLIPLPDRGFLAVLRDLSEQQIDREEARAAKTAAAQALQDRARFLAEMSHELRTPLNAIIGFAEIIATQRFGTDAAERYRQYAQHILTSAEHMRDSIDEIGAGLPTLEPAGREPAQRISVSALVAEVSGLLHPRAEAKSITLQCHVDGDPTIYGDPASLRQILLNLGSDAIENTPDNGRVSVAVAPDSDGRLSFAVTDDGGGIEAAAIPMLFDPYVRGKNQGARPGLSVIKTLVEIHGGEFSVDSITGKGATFRVTLPEDRWSAAGDDPLPHPTLNE